ncbi:MAG: hypothetical protein ABR499_20980 [Gemmatimonadaceae bacterium]
MTALCACWTTDCATCCARASTPSFFFDRPPPERLRVERLLLRPPVLRLLLRPPLLRPPLLREEEPDRPDADRPDDLRPPPLDRPDELRDDDERDDPPRDELRDDERDDDPPRLRADFRPRFAPPDRRDELLLPDFLRDPRLEVAIPIPGWKKLSGVLSKIRARVQLTADCGLRTRTIRMLLRR